MSIRLVQISVTLNDLERRNGPDFASLYYVLIYSAEKLPVCFNKLTYLLRTCLAYS